MPAKNYDQVLQILKDNQFRWLVTGAAGFIGSNLVECLLDKDQKVTGLDNFITGHRHNLKEVQEQVSSAQWSRFRMVEGDIRHIQTCLDCAEDVDFVLHQAAVGSVPRSIKDPMIAHTINVDGFVNMLEAARIKKAKRFVYAASSSTYGDHPDLPKREDRIGAPLSPYAVTKYVNELYAQVYARVYGMETVGLRYFNVFGPRQDPNGPYAAVIPKWIGALLQNEPAYINGDGETTRDFTYIDNVIQINLLAALNDTSVAGEVFNVAVGERTSLIDLFTSIRSALAKINPAQTHVEPEFRDFRPGDVRHSQADIGKARLRLGYEGRYKLAESIDKTISWHLAKQARP